MSWLEKLENNVFTIKTGDGKIFTPLWKDAEKSKEYNTSVYDFIEVSGSFIDRKKPKSGKYPLVFWFQGEDNIEQSNEFENSADDPRAWELTHPFYGVIKGQPLSLSRNDKNYNVTEISIDFWESITEDYPNNKVSIVDATQTKTSLVSDNCSISYASDKTVFNSEDITKNKDANVLTNSAFTNDLEGDDFADYQLIFAAAQKGNDNLLSDPLNAIGLTSELLNFPSTLLNSITDKLKSYLVAYNNFSNVFQSIADKLFFESQAGLTIANYCNASVNTVATDYEIRSEVEQAVTDLLTMYDNYLSTLDNASISIYDVDNAWQPNVDLQLSIYNLVMFTIGNLYNLAFDAKQERIVYTDKQTNLILLTHKYLGLDATDENIEKFRTINNIKMDELFKVKKDRQIKYYV